jgi:hypothetical protein
LKYTDFLDTLYSGKRPSSDEVKNMSKLEMMAYSQFILDENEETRCKAVEIILVIKMHQKEI